MPNLNLEKFIKMKPVYPEEFKKKFLGEGEWVTELDYFPLCYKGYNAFIRRCLLMEASEKKSYFGGHLCGYVQIIKDHALFGKDFESCKNEFYINCHGGITFNESDDKIHVIGFDCGHFNDLIPSVDYLIKKIPGIREIQKKSKEICGKLWDSYLLKTYKNMEFCITQCKSIIDQLIDIEKN